MLILWIFVDTYATFNGPFSLNYNPRYFSRCAEGTINVGFFFTYFSSSFVDNLQFIQMKCQIRMHFLVSCVCVFFPRKFKLFRMWERKKNKTIRTEHNVILRNRLKKRSNTELYTDLVVSANPYAHVQQTKKTKQMK